VHDEADSWARFAVIRYPRHAGDNEWVYSARRWDNTAASYICQLQQQGLFSSKFSSGGNSLKSDQTYYSFLE